jgi:hypothetical protein
MSTLHLQTDRAEFRRHAVESDRCAAAGDEAAARAESDRLAEIADWWEQQGRVVDFLSPFLAESELPSVRFDAASWLLHCGHPALAVPVLEDLRRSQGPQAAEAGLQLDDWREHCS